MFLKILPSKRRFSFAPFNSTNFSYYKRVMLLQTNFLSLEKFTAVNSDYIKIRSAVTDRCIPSELFLEHVYDIEFHLKPFSNFRAESCDQTSGKAGLPAVPCILCIFCKQRKLLKEFRINFHNSSRLS